MTMGSADQSDFESCLSSGLREAFRQIHDMLVRSETLRGRLDALEEPLRTWEFSVRGQPPRGRRLRTATEELENRLEAASAGWREVLVVDREALLLLRAAMGKLRSRASGEECRLPLACFAALERSVSCHHGSVEAIEELLALSGRIAALLPEAEPEETCALLDRRRRHIEATVELRRDAGRAEEEARAAVATEPPAAEPGTADPAQAGDGFRTWLDAVIEETSPPSAALRPPARAGFKDEVRRALAAAESELSAGEARQQESDRLRAMAEERAAKTERERDEALAVVASLQRRLASAGLTNVESMEDRALIEEVSGLRRAVLEQQRELRRMKEMLLGIGEEIERSRTARAVTPLRLGAELTGV
jgi:hypothetical protein